MSAAVIIDSGGANIASLRAALARLGTDSVVTTDHGVIQRAPRVFLPGVGSAQDAMHRLRIAGLDQLIPTLKQPLLGICLGMQILFDRSEEGPANTLGVIPGSVDKLHSARGLPVPHMGWNQLEPLRDDPLFDVEEPLSDFRWKQIEVGLADQVFRLFQADIPRHGVICHDETAARVLDEQVVWNLIDHGAE